MVCVSEGGAERGGWEVVGVCSWVCGGRQHHLPDQLGSQVSDHVEGDLEASRRGAVQSRIGGV